VIHLGEGLNLKLRFTMRPSCGMIVNMTGLSLNSAAIGRTLLAGLAGGLTLNLALLFTFRALGFGWHGDGILLTSPSQSPKLIAVWTTLKPLPLVVSHPTPIIIGLFLLRLVTPLFTAG
jgi:hypothetical protein